MRLLLSILFCFYCVNCLKILCIFPAPHHSHYTVGFILMKQLAQRGHNITFVAPFKEKEPIENFRTIHLTGVVEEFEEFSKSRDLLSNNNKPVFVIVPILGVMGNMMVDRTLSHENVQNLLTSNEKFDVVLVELFASDGLLAVANHFKAPSVLVSSIGQSTLSSHILGNPEIPSYMPSIMLEPPIHTSFFKRTYNYLLYIFMRLFKHYYFIPKQNEIIHKYFPNAPHLYDIIHNTSLILFNSDESFNEPLPMLPNMINIGGYHVESPKKLPEDLQDILDSAKDGVIYFSMGSVLKSKDISVTLRKDILDVLAQLKETVLWKFEEDLPRKPSNVIVRKWFPQSDILAHPNLKLFITHGGILSTIEALARGIPIMGIPVFGDQRTNTANAVIRGQGLMVPYSDLSKEKLSQALNEMLSNPKYTENAKQSSKLLRDRQIDPLDKAEYWLEYVVRHKGAKHLRSVALDLTWYQYESFDVILFLTAVTSVLFIIFYAIIKRLLRRKTQLKIKKK